MSEPIRVGMVVEGPSDFVFFREVLSTFRRQGIETKVVHASGRPRLIQEARRHLHALRSGNCQRILFFIDQDVEACAPVVAALLNDVRGEEDVIFRKHCKMNV